ncbi:hypothetical protein AA15973_1694 [Komagataeibacter sucrofermentans DSM 15973]|nr:hypothetical protein AA15973_1694 [Komagataeibacter sucrofermentans DSM 15973]
MKPVNPAPAYGRGMDMSSKPPYAVHRAIGASPFMLLPHGMGRKSCSTGGSILHVQAAWS